MGNKHMKRCSISIIIREMQITTTVKYPLMDMRHHPIRMATINKQTNKIKQKMSVGEDVEKLEPMCTVGGNIK